MGKELAIITQGSDLKSPEPRGEAKESSIHLTFLNFYMLGRLPEPPGPGKQQRNPVSSNVEAENQPLRWFSNLYSVLRTCAKAIGEHTNTHT